MDKYLLQILKDVNTIIIPGLGALTITNKDTGEIMFMSYLKHDDGKLSSYISENEGIDENEAKNLIAKYVREITTFLDKGESYDMFKFGTFYKDGDDVGFKNWSEGTEQKNEKKEIERPKTAKKEPPKKKKVKEDIVKSTKPDETNQKEKIISTDKSETNQNKEEETNKDKKIQSSYTTVVAEEKAEEFKPEMNILQKEELSSSVEKLESLKKQKTNKTDKKKRGVGFWMLLVLILVLVSGGTYVGFNYDTVKQHIPFLADKAPIEKSDALGEMKEILGEQVGEDKEQEDDSDVMEEESVEEESLEEDSIEEIVEVPNEKVEKEVASYSGNDLPFHIIAGAFSSEANANRLGDKLRLKGYNVKIGMGRGMHLVSINSYATRAEANAGLSEVKDAAPKGWVYEWK